MNTRPCKGYSQQEKLGAGSYGKVQRVATPSGHIYAQKLQTEITLVEFQAHKLNHPNIVTCHDIQFNCDNAPVSIYISPVGKSLSDIMEASYLDWTQKFKFIGEIIDGVAHLHYNNILHLDLKPDNIIINNNTAYIIDFGLSVYGKSKLTLREKYPRITSWYRDPSIDDEHLKYKTRSYSRKSDLYSLAIIIMVIFSNDIFSTYISNQTKEEYIDMSNIEKILQTSLLADYKSWAKLIKQLIDGDLDTFDLVNHPLLHYHKFSARKMGEIQYPIVNSNPDYVQNLVNDAIATIVDNGLDNLPYYILAYHIKLCLRGPQVSTIDNLLNIYSSDFYVDNQYVTKYFHQKITLLESLDDCVQFHRLILGGNYEQALEIEPKDVVLLGAATVREVLDIVQNE